MTLHNQARRRKPISSDVAEESDKRCCIFPAPLHTHSYDLDHCRGARRLRLRRRRAAAPARPPPQPAGDLGRRGQQCLGARRLPLPGPRPRLRRPRLLHRRRGPEQGRRGAVRGPAAAIAERLGAAAGLVVDLSADFRLHDPAAYPTWYGTPHPHPEELGTWPYGLPELHRDELRGARRVAVPGCYPTAALLALAPLVAAGLVEPDGIVVDAKSGVSGAGRSLSDAYLYVQANENVTPYGVGRHRHTPEIEQELGRAAGRPLTVTFTPHLVPMSRGLLATCYATLAAGAGAEELAAAQAAAFAAEPFVDLLPAGAWPATRAVVASNRAQVAAAVLGGHKVVAASAIDNLVKGAAGQALQCANLALGLPETAGLELVPLGP